MIILSNIQVRNKEFIKIRTHGHLKTCKLNIKWNNDEHTVMYQSNR